MTAIRVAVGERVYLSTVDVGDYERYAVWVNDPEVSVFTMSARIFPLEAEKEFITGAAKRGDFIFGVRLAADDRLIGNIGFIEIEHIHRRATMGVFIGESEYRSKGYGSEAIMLALDYGFNALNFNNIQLKVYSYNARAIRCYEKCGFKVIGRRRQSQIINGQKYDEIYMDILAEEFQGSPFGKKLSGIIEGKK